MEIRQCERCSKLFHYRGNRNCPDCVRELDDIFLKVRNFLDDNPKASVEDVCEAIDADEEDVLGWLREGRLILSRDNNPLLTCQLCRAPIQSGRYCEVCAIKVVGQLERTSQYFEEDKTAKNNRNDDKHKRVHLHLGRD